MFIKVIDLKELRAPPVKPLIASRAVIAILKIAETEEMLKRAKPYLAFASFYMLLFRKHNPQNNEVYILL